MFQTKTSKKRNRSFDIFLFQMTFDLVERVYLGQQIVTRNMICQEYGVRNSKMYTVRTSLRYCGMMNDGIMNPMIYTGCTHIKNTFCTSKKYTRNNLFLYVSDQDKQKNAIDVLDFLGSLTFRRHLIEWKESI